MEIFLSSHLSSLKQCDIVVRDFKAPGDEKTFYVSKDSDSDLIKPFSKSALILALESRYEKIFPKEKQELGSFSESTVDFSILEKRIDLLTREYQSNILKAVKAFYEK